MDPAEKATKFAMAMSEGLNLLGVFLCGPALGKLREQAPELLRQWEAEYAPVFRQMDIPDTNGDPAMISTSVAKISDMIAAGVDVGAPGQLARLRGAIRELLGAMRIPVPALPAAEAAVCELHGTACPALEGESGSFGGTS